MAMAGLLSTLIEAQSFLAGSMDWRIPMVCYRHLLEKYQEEKHDIWSKRLLSILDLENIFFSIPHVKQLYINRRK